MYIKKIKIQNYGSIINFEYEMKFDNDGNPKPLILIGKNGSGKTLAIANIVDALIEAKRVAYPQYIPEVKENNYYKVGKITYINNNAEFCFVKILLCNKDKNFDYIEIMSRNAENTIKTNPQLDCELQDKNYFIENGFSKKSTFDLSSKDFNESCYLYFPVDRYYIPNWFNEENYSKMNYDKDERFVGKSNTNLIKTDVVSNIKKWLHEVFLAKESILIANPENNTPFIRNYINTPVQNMILAILNAIRNEQIYIQGVSYKTNFVPIVSNSYNIPDINNLSSGESMLLGLFASIIKEYDMSHSNFTLGDIEGIALIDEIDLNLHISQQKDILPKLIKLFPKIQFIITTHSPFFLTGMKEVFDCSCDFVNMPNGEEINELDNFSEIENAIQLFNSEGNKIIECNKELKYQIDRIKLIQDKTLVITEGKTDAQYIIEAYKRLKIKIPNIEIYGLDDKVDDRNGDMALLGILKTEKTIGKNNIIGIFDRDNDTILQNLSNEPFTEFLKNKIYAFAIPVPDSRKSEKKISIEHYFSDKELKTETDDDHRLYLVNEFYKTTGYHKKDDKICKYISDKNKCEGNHILSGSDVQKVTDKTGENNYSLSKAGYANKVCENNAPFNDFNFDNFKLIIGLINKILEKFDKSDN